MYESPIKDEWFKSASDFAAGAKFYVALGNRKLAAFSYHQAAERFYHCILLVLTLYSPKSHKLNFLRSQAESHALGLIDVWPRDTRFAKRCFELLRRAYVDARYSPQYKITKPELDWLGERIELLQSLVHQICEARFAHG